MMNRIATLAKYLPQGLTGQPAKDIYFVTDASNWILDWVAHYVTAQLEAQYQLSTQVTGTPLRMRNQLVHFVDRYIYLNHLFRKIHPSNKVFLNWFHGDLNDTSPNTQRLFAHLLEAVNAIEQIVVSCQISRQNLLEAGIPEGKLVTIPLGVDLSRFFPPTAEVRRRARAKLGIGANVVCIGSFQKDGSGWGEGLEPKPIKGPDIFLEVIAGLTTRYPNLMVLLTGPARGYVKQGLEKLGVPYLHHFLDHYHDILPYYHALDLYLIPARCEGGPAALLESWATQVPVVSTRVGMPADLIQHGQNGMLAEVEDVAGLTGHIITLIENDKMRENCRRQGLEDVKLYDWSLIAGQYYQKLYRRFLEDGPA